MQRLKALLAQILTALARGGSGAARRQADEQVVQSAQQGMRMATETSEANQADFGRHYEEWHGVLPDPKTPREDPHHVAKARMGRIAERFLLALKVVFWVVFGPAYFNVLAWLAVIIALCISITLSLGIKPLLAGLILKPGLTPHQEECRFHAHLVAGITAFAIAFGGLFLLRGLVGPLALIGALLVLPVLSVCDLVLLYLMGIAHAFAQLYSWAAPFVRDHHASTAYVAEFEQHYRAAQLRLGDGHQNIVALALEATQTELEASPTIDPQKMPASQGRARSASTIAMSLVIGVLCVTGARGQAIAPDASLTRGASAELRWDSTSSLYPSILSTITPLLAHTFPVWADQLGAHRIRVSTFERDGWLPRTISEITREQSLRECVSGQREGNIFRGISDALDKQTRDTCEQAKARQADRILAELSTALAAAAHAAPVVDPKLGRSCTAFFDTAAAAARAPVGNLIVIVSDTEETCKTVANPVPEHAAGADVIIILVPSRADMGPGVSAASRFSAKKAYLQRIAPWLRAILAPADIETYRLPVAPSTTPITKVSFWQNEGPVR